MCLTSKATVSPKPGMASCKAATVAASRSCKRRGSRVRSFWRKRTSLGSVFWQSKPNGAASIEDEMKAQFDHEQGMFEQKATELAGVDQAFANANQKGFEIGAFRMGRSSTSRTLSLPLLNEGPIQQGKESAVVHHHRVMLKQSSHG